MIMSGTRLLMTVIFGMLVVLGGVPSTANAQETFKFKVAIPWPGKHPATKAIDAMFADIKQRSSGRLQLEAVHLETIGFKQADILRVLQQGVTDMALLVPYYVGRDAPKLANVAPSGALIDPEDNWKIEKIQRAYAEKVLKDDWNAVMPMRFFNRGGKYLVIVSRDPVRSLADLKGKKLRHFERPGLRAMAALGISAQTIAQADLYLALKTGVVDAAVHGITNAAEQSINEVACCFSVFTPFTAYAAPYGFIMLKDQWAKVPADLLKIMRDASEADWDKGLTEWRAGKEDLDAEQTLKSRGMKQMPPFSVKDRQTLQKAVFQAWHEESEKLGPDSLEMYEQAVTALTAK